MGKSHRNGKSPREFQSKKSYSQGGDHWTEHKAKPEKHAVNRPNPTATSSENEHVDEAEACPIPEVIGPSRDIGSQCRTRGELVKQQDTHQARKISGHEAEPESRQSNCLQRKRRYGPRPQADGYQASK